MKGNWMLVTLMGLGLVLPLRAADAPTEPPKEEPPKQEEPKKPEEPARVSEKRNKPAGRIAAEFDVPESEVLDLRDKGLGWGEIRHALAISRRSGQPTSEILKLRESGMGWGQISRKFGFKLGEATGKGFWSVREERADAEQAEARFQGRRLETGRERPGRGEGGGPAERGRGRGHGRGPRR